MPKKSTKKPAVKKGSAKKRTVKLTPARLELLASEYSVEAEKLWTQFQLGVTQFNPSVKIAPTLRDHIRGRRVKTNLEDILLLPPAQKLATLRSVQNCAREAGIICSFIAFETDREINAADYNKAEDVVRVIETGVHRGGRLCD